MASLLAKDDNDFVAVDLLSRAGTEACIETLRSIIETALLQDINNKNPVTNPNPNPNRLPLFGIYTVWYLVHRLAYETNSCYAVLGFKYAEGSTRVEGEIKKRYEVLVKLFDDHQPPVMETCSSSSSPSSPFEAIMSAKRIVSEAWEAVLDARRREAYDRNCQDTKNLGNKLITRIKNLEI